MKRRPNSRSHPARKVIRRTVAEFPAPTPQATPCRLWQGSVRNGYGRKWLHDEQRMQYMHRWVWEQLHGPLVAGMCVLHRCDNRLCYRYDHLFLGTKKDNTADMTAKGRDRGRFAHSDNPLDKQRSACVTAVVYSISGFSPWRLTA